MTFRVCCLVGWSGSGKTTLAEQLVRVLTGRGTRVAAVKHSSDPHRKGREDSDSERLAAAGAFCTAFVAPGRFDLRGSAIDDRLASALLEAAAGMADLVLVEGWKNGPFPKIEVWRKGVQAPIAHIRSDVIAIVTDDPISTPLPVFRCNEVERIADFILEQATHHS